MPPEPFLLTRELHRRADALGELIRRVDRVAELNRSLKLWTQEPWIDAIRLVNVRNHVAVLFAENAAAHQALRYRSDSLLRYLRENLGLDVQRLDVKVKPAAASRRPGV